uniref:Uncharacterized protein n=1 Tax=Glossina palpalis gambiensis TaxID=67801 RepID=A0A1B0AUZ7_9MUSC
MAGGYWDTNNIFGLHAFSPTWLIYVQVLEAKNINISELVDNVKCTYVRTYVAAVAFQCMKRKEEQNNNNNNNNIIKIKQMHSNTGQACDVLLA